MEYGKGNAFSVENFREVREWQSPNDTELLWRRMATLGSNLDAMNAIYGTPTGKFKGSEFMFSVWTVERKGLTIHLLSAEGKGTCIEAELPEGCSPWEKLPKGVGKELASFMQEHLERLESVMGVRVPPAPSGRKPGRKA